MKTFQQYGMKLMEFTGISKRNECLVTLPDALIKMPIWHAPPPIKALSALRPTLGQLVSVQLKSTSSGEE
jgi:hypothetical protein